MKAARCLGMRGAVLLLLLVGCIDEREAYVADPLVQIASLRCEIAGAQVVIDGTFDVRLQEGQTFRVEHVAALGTAKSSVYAFYGCNEWTKMQAGCMRAGDQPETQPVSLHMTDNVSGTLPDLVKVEVTGVVETEDMIVEASRGLTCLR